MCTLCTAVTRIIALLLLISGMNATNVCQHANAMLFDRLTFASQLGATQHMGRNDAAQ